MSDDTPDTPDAVATEPPGDDRPIRYTEDRADGKRITMYRASSLARCERAFIAAACGEFAQPPGEFMEQVFREGHLMEPMIREMFEQETGHKVSAVQGAVEIQVQDGVFIRGHVDGLYAMDHPFGAVGLFEAKKIRADGWTDFVRKGPLVNKNYIPQLAAYRWGLGAREVSFVGGRFEDGEITEIKVFKFTPEDDPHGLFDGSAMFEVLTRIQQIESLVAEGFAPRDVECCEPLDYPCPYYRLHDEVEVKGVDAVELPESTRETVARFLAISDEAKRVTKIADGLQREKKKLTTKLREMLVEAGLDDAREFTGEINGQRVELTRVVSEVAEHMVKASKRDFFRIKTETETPKPETPETPEPETPGEQP